MQPARQPAPNDLAAGLSVGIDRGIASYVYPLAGESVDALLEDPLRGWGEPSPANVSSGCALVSGTPSATLARRMDDLSEPFQR